MTNPLSEDVVQAPIVITIDGPAGTGKSTVARALAERLGIEFLDTGAMYRAVAWKCLLAHIPLEDPRACSELAETLSFSLENHRLLVDGTDPGSVLRSDDVTEFSSRYAAIEQVRAILVEQQRRIAVRQSLVTEGRDQGTVVFPEAACKFFLTARPEVRAQRRFQDLQTQLNAPTYEQVLEAQTARDLRDANRTIAPLKPAADAKIIDTSDREFEEVLCGLEQAVQQIIK